MLKQNQTESILPYGIQVRPQIQIQTLDFPSAFGSQNSGELSNRQSHLLWQGLAQDTGIMKDHNKILWILILSRPSFSSDLP